MTIVEEDIRRIGGDGLKINKTKYPPGEVPEECPACGCPDFTKKMDRRRNPPWYYRCTNCNYC